LFLLGLSLCSRLGVDLGIPLAANCPDQQGDPLIGIEASLSLESEDGGILTASDLLHLKLAGSSLEVSDPLAADGTGQKGDPLIDIDGLLPHGSTLTVGDLAGSTLEVGSPLGLACPDQTGNPLIAINAHQLPLNVLGNGFGDGGDPLLASLLAPGPGPLGSATEVVSGLLAWDRDGDSDDCGCGDLLQPLLGTVVDQLDHLLA
jgi:hypothetical protein